jgi:hypothetical protein
MCASHPSSSFDSFPISSMLCLASKLQLFMDKIVLWRYSEFYQSSSLLSILIHDIIPFAFSVKIVNACVIFGIAVSV